MITLDATSNSGAVASVSTKSWSHTVGTGANSILIVVVMGNDTTSDRNVTGITYAGQALTFFAGYEDGVHTYRLDVYYKLNPTVGANNVIVTWQGNVNFAGAEAYSFFGVDQVSPTDGSNTATATGNPSVSITTTKANDLLIDCIYSELGSDLTVGGGQTVNAQIGVNGGGDRAVSSYKIATSVGSNTMSWTGSAVYDDIVCAFKAAPDGGAFILNMI